MPLKSILMLAAGIVVLAAAGLVVIAAGLPERSAYTGETLVSGLVIAPELNAYAPDFTADVLDGAPVTLSALRGTPVILNFWATWCGPCRVEMPDLQALYAAHQADGLRILAVNLGETPAAMRPWRDELGLTFDLLLDPQGDIAGMYHLRGQPSTYVIAPDGIITHIFYGPTTQTALEAALGS
ncbi:MAG: TlpA family protein disulfide reductase [Anaerolineae bacterium]|nr:TlpA family protein disulfide reductase [Anaerolineae bacterium]